MPDIVESCVFWQVKRSVREKNIKDDSDKLSKALTAISHFMTHNFYSKTFLQFYFESKNNKNIETMMDLFLV